MASIRMHPDTPSPPRHGQPIRDSIAGPGLFIAAAVASALGVAATYGFFVRTTTGQYIDESALDEAVDVYGRAVKAALGFLDALPTIAVVVGAAGLLYAAVVKRRWFAAAVALSSAAAANLITQVLKAYVFTRPFRGVETLMENSLPSGHTTLAASAAAAVFLVASPSKRPFVAFAGSTFAIASGAATLVNQWHRPADVVAAFLVVGACTAPAGWLIMRVGWRWNAWQGFGSGWAASRLWLSLPLLAGLGATALAVSVLVRIAPGSGTASTTHYFWAGVSLIVISGYLLCIAATWLFSVAARRA
ncbi:phosphatase PAP2 family protein [Sinomonas sp. JGH33]|uniref:Phosphatase PAP2 family protein n=1 Tax=Sinomonas terricola TaxID=3110330 RepID=A0ABU5T255_9MICC|nr:phosphatase PAP2 family protein [Sinomonas sp. JGH33]MEA5453650.1 phosphatase PAP2 family protein [Sinomonas sp. JGH33]